MRSAILLAVVAMVGAGIAVAQGTPPADLPRPPSRPAVQTPPEPVLQRPLPRPVLAAPGAVTVPVRPPARPQPVLTAAPPAPEAAPVPAPAPEAAQVAAPAPVIRPRARPVQVAAVPQPARAASAVVVRLTSSLRPLPRPQGLEAPEPELVSAALIRPNPGREAVRSRKGSVCGDPSIRGERLAPIPARIKGCGIEEPVRVTSIDGVALSTPATLHCDTARALKAWIDTGLRPAFGRREVVELKVAAHYACRPRNNQAGAKVSEHGRGRAIDISGFTLSNGTILSVDSNWRGKSGSPIRQAHKAACGVFNTTLGPGSDGFHEDHLHFDTARGRGPYCR